MAAANPGVTTTFVIGTTPVQVCATNTERRGLRLENINQTNPLSYGFGTGNGANSSMHFLNTASVIQFGPNGLEVSGKISIPAVVPGGDVSVICTVTTGSLVVTEW